MKHRRSFYSTTIAAVVEQLDEREALLRNALKESDVLRSVIHDGLTGRNDVWLKTQLLNALDAVDDNVRKAL